MAYYLLRCSQPKGQWKQIYIRKDSFEKEDDQTACCSCFAAKKDRGGKLTMFMFYERVVILVSVALMVSLIYLATEQNKWQV